MARLVRAAAVVLGVSATVAAAQNAHVVTLYVPGAVLPGVPVWLVLAAAALCGAIPGLLLGAPAGRRVPRGPDRRSANGAGGRARVGARSAASAHRRAAVRPGIGAAARRTFRGGGAAGRTRRMGGPTRGHPLLTAAPSGRRVRSEPCPAARPDGSDDGLPEAAEGSGPSGAGLGAGGHRSRGAPGAEDDGPGGPAMRMPTAGGLPTPVTPGRATCGPRAALLRGGRS
jgi:hypothetical protein